MKNHDRLSAIQSVLMESWDPIGVKGVAAARDEYDSYIPEIMRLIERRVSVADLAKYLSEIATVEMGLTDVEHRDRTTAEQLLELFRR